MSKPLIAEDILPIVASLSAHERRRLLRLIISPIGGDGAAYEAAPATADEFGSDEEPLAWEADGWEEFQ